MRTQRKPSLLQHSLAWGISIIHGAFRWRENCGKVTTNYRKRYGKVAKRGKKWYKKFVLPSSRSSWSNTRCLMPNVYDLGRIFAPNYLQTTHYSPSHLYFYIWAIALHFTFHAFPNFYLSMCRNHFSSPLFFFPFLFPISLYTQTIPIPHFYLSRSTYTWYTIHYTGI